MSEGSSNEVVAHFTYGGEIFEMPVSPSDTVKGVLEDVNRLSNFQNTSGGTFTGLKKDNEVFTETRTMESLGVGAGPTCEFELVFTPEEAGED